jgi:hypothetical protein
MLMQLLRQQGMMNQSGGMMGGAPQPQGQMPPAQGQLPPMNQGAQPPQEGRMGGPNIGALESQLPQLQPKAPGGMFGGDGKFGIGQALVAALNGYLASRGNPVGMANIKMMQDAMRSKREGAEYDRRRQQQLQDQISMYDYRAAHPEAPAPTEYERALSAAGIMPGTPEYAKHMNNYVQMKENPVWTYTDPATGAVMMGSKGPMQQPEIIPTLPPGAKPIGGPSPSGSGGFSGY